jgi:hypothetical protein
LWPNTTINIGIDIFVVSSFIHAYGQFNVLKYSLRTIREWVEELAAQEMIYLERSGNENEIPKGKKDVKSKEPDVTSGKFCT